MPQPDDGYFIGSTVKLRIKANIAGTRTPANTTVTLVALALDGDSIPLPTVTTYDKRADGDYELRIPTAGMSPGGYRYVTVVGDDPTAQTVTEDGFTLKATTVPLPPP